jgi:cell division protein FtsX
MPGNPFTDPNWAADIADTIERVVGTVRDRTTTPLVKASRGVVFGLLAAMLGVVAVTLLVIVATRAVQALLDIWFRHEVSVYLSYLIVGGIICLGGMLVLGKRYSNDS